MRRPHGLLAAALLLGLALAPVLAPGAGRAQGLALGESAGSGPLNVEADDGIEWRRDEQVYIARGNARATRGNVTVRADTLTARYRPKPGGSDTEIWRLEAEGGVVITSPSETAYGDRAVYTIDDRIMVLTGRALKMVTQTDVITARDSLEYWEDDRLAVARGQARDVRQDREIRADVLTARFAPDRDGKLQLSRIDAFGNVDIRTPKEIARGAQGVYTAANGVATLVGDVRITRGQNQLNGEVAEVNLNTGVSRMLSAGRGEQAKSRVRGLFVPEKQQGNQR